MIQSYFYYNDVKRSLRMTEVLHIYVKLDHAPKKTERVASPDTHYWDATSHARARTITFNMLAKYLVDVLHYWKTCHSPLRL